MNLFTELTFDNRSETPLYRQLAETIKAAILSGMLSRGERLPPTRELAGQLGLNRTTVSAAYAVLEEAGLLQGSVGRGSFVALESAPQTSNGFDWNSILAPAQASPNAAPAEAAVDFGSSRPAEVCFPLAQFRRLAKEVVDGPQASAILQLGSPYGYAPLRQWLLSEGSRQGWISSKDDLLITSGCQQALDLIARILVNDGTPVLVEDPVYHGLLRVLGRSGAQLLPVPVSDCGLNLQTVANMAAQHRPRLLAVMPDFQNPTGTSLPLGERKALLELAQRFGMVLIEIGVYRDLRYKGKPLPTLKQLDQSGLVISIGSYSKVAFPGLRVGWIAAAKPVVCRLAEAKQTSDLHSDQLSQAVLLRFVESGELDRHLQQTRRAGAQRLAAALEACSRFLPIGARFTKPEGGMSLWVELPPPLEADDVLRAAREAGVSFMPGPHFSVVRGGHPRGLRLSFGGLTPAEIERGIELLGAVASRLLEAAAQVSLIPDMAIV